MTPEATHTPNPPPASRATGARPVRNCTHAAALAETPIRDLVTTARTFYAAINRRQSGISDDDMDVLGRFDDVLSQMIAKRPAQTAKEAALKAEYLTGRVQAGNMSDEADAAALEAMRADFATLAGRPPAEPPQAPDSPGSAPEGPFARLGGFDLVTALEGPITTLGTRVAFLREFFEDASAHMEHDALYLFLSDCEAETRDLQRAWDALWIAVGGKCSGDYAATAEAA